MMTIWKKVLLSVLLAFIFSWLLCGCAEPVSRPTQFIEVQFSHHSTNLKYLQDSYRESNEEYFDGKLPKDISIDLNETENMASTFCDPTATICVIHFNLKYTLAPRVAALTMLHEQCHIKRWVDQEHGKAWRTCMLNLDAQGAFREHLIDNYENEKK